MLFDTLLAEDIIMINCLFPLQLHSDRCAMIAVTPDVYACMCSLPIPCSSSFCGPIPCSSFCGCVPFSTCSSSLCGCVPFLYSLLKLLLWMRSLPIPSFCGCIPFLFPAQAPSVDVFSSYSLLKLLLWMCSLPIPSSSSFCGCVHFQSLLKLLLWLCSLLFPAPYVDVFLSFFLFKLLLPCSLPSTCSAVTCTHCSVCLWALQ